MKFKVKVHFHVFFFFPGVEMMMNPSMSSTNSNGDELMSLEAEITELQRENARVESQMLRLKSDINAMESQLSNGERVRKLRLVETGNWLYNFIFSSALTLHVKWSRNACLNLINIFLFFLCYFYFIFRPFFFILTFCNLSA